MKDKTGCRFCTERYVGCHSNCETYKNYREGLDKSIQEIREAKKQLYGEFCAFKREQVRKEAKKARYKR